MYYHLHIVCLIIIAIIIIIWNWRWKYIRKFEKFSKLNTSNTPYTPSITNELNNKDKLMNAKLKQVINKINNTDFNDSRKLNEAKIEYVSLLAQEHFFTKLQTLPIIQIGYCCAFANDLKYSIVKYNQENENNENNEINKDVKIDQVPMKLVEKIFGSDGNLRYGFGLLHSINPTKSMGAHNDHKQYQ